MRRILSLTLAAIMLATALASCAGAPKTAVISPRITLTSSDGESAAEWLTARLEAIPDRVVVGTDGVVSAGAEAEFSAGFGVSCGVFSPHPASTLSKSSAESSRVIVLFI